MKRASLIVAAAIVMVANMSALVHAWRNRSGPVDTDITLSERELPMSYRANDDDSGVSLDLRWQDPTWTFFGRDRPDPWLDQKILRELGFDTSVPPSEDAAKEFYPRQRARRAFVALEYDGPAWRKHVEQMEAQSAGSLLMPRRSHTHEGETHLIVIDAGADPARLRARHPDRHSVIVVPAVVRMFMQPFSPASNGNPSRPAQLTGSVQAISSIHVPRPFSDAFRQLPKERSNVNYRVHLSFGASYEPWIAGVEFTEPSKQ